MTDKVALRSGKDRLRYTVTFELTLLCILVPAGALFFEKPLSEIGVLGIVLAIKAMLVNLAFNWVFDKVDARYGRVSSDRGTLGRIVHAVGFELTLLCTSLPLYMWWLNLSFFEALATDIVVTSLVVVYTYVFTLGYDRLFPVVPRETVADG